jgi:molybdate transport system substrate-binding protein
MYTAGVITQSANAKQAQMLIGLLTNADQRELRRRAGFLNVKQ